MKRLAIAALAAGLLAAGPARAQQPPPPAAGGAVNRHLGFYLNLGLGFGHMKSTASTVLGDAEVSGGSGIFTFAVGGALSENLVLAGHMWANSATSPTVKLGTLSGSTSSDTSASISGIGPSLVYYVMPLNLYLQVTPSLTTLSTKSGGSTASTETGLGLWFGVGKEWWVSDHWGLGLAGNLAFCSNKDKGTNPPTWKSTGVGILFSATYN